MFFSGQKSNNNSSAFEEALNAIQKQVGEANGKLPSVCLIKSPDHNLQLQQPSKPTFQLALKV